MNIVLAHTQSKITANVVKHVQVLVLKDFFLQKKAIGFA